MGSPYTLLPPRSDHGGRSSKEPRLERSGIQLFQKSGPAPSHIHRRNHVRAIPDRLVRPFQDAEATPNTPQHMESDPREAANVIERDVDHERQRLANDHEFRMQVKHIMWELMEDRLLDFSNQYSGTGGGDRAGRMHSTRVHGGHLCLTQQGDNMRRRSPGDFSPIIPDLIPSHPEPPPGQSDQRPRISSAGCNTELVQPLCTNAKNLLDSTQGEVEEARENVSKLVNQKSNGGWHGSVAESSSTEVCALYRRFSRF